MAETDIHSGATISRMLPLKNIILVQTITVRVHDGRHWLFRFSRDNKYSGNRGVCRHQLYRHKQSIVLHANACLNVSMHA